MPTVHFGRKDEGAVTFAPSPDLIAVRTRSTRSLRSGPVQPAAAAELDDANLVLAFPEAGVEVYRVGAPDARSLETRKAALRAAPDVRFAGGVLVDEKSGEPVVYTENIFIKFVDSADRDGCRAVIRETGLMIKDEPDYATNAFFAAAPEGTGTRVFEIAQALLNREDVEFCHPEIVRRRQMRVIAVEQWHLQSTTIGSVPVAASANAAAAHAVTKGEGVTIALIDDGFDVDHPEFSRGGKVVSPRDITQGTNDARPKDLSPFFPDDHGTACAGVACADGSHGASGVAPAARLMPIRLADGLGSVREAEAFRWAADHGADVISCSWGPPDGRWSNPNDPLHHDVAPLPAHTRLAIDHAVTNGRNGKGCVVLFAAGNGNERVDNDGYASYANVIAVAACNDRGKRSVYSDFGRAIWCAFPSGDFEFGASHPAPLTSGIWTTDRNGSRGYNSGRLHLGDAAGNYTNSFNGTSSACPGAAGVAALVLSVNPDLTAAEVREILARSADRIDPQGGDYQNNRSALYGFGRLNAVAAVQLAQPTPRNRVSIIRSFGVDLPDLSRVEVALDVTAVQAIEDIVVHVDINHTYIGDLVVTLVPPAGMSRPPVVLHNRTGGDRKRLNQIYRSATIPALAALNGGSPQGAWVLRVEDRAARDRGTLAKFGIELGLAPADRSPAERSLDVAVRYDSGQALA
ncbi:MAG: S8 family serine peptidase [Vicinamibacterales bacterium]